MTEEVRLQGEFDCRVWASEFRRVALTRAAECSTPAEIDLDDLFDEAWLQTWFANAIMSGYDHYAKEHPTHLQMVKDFHELMGHPVRTKPTSDTPVEEARLRAKLILEEAQETITAMGFEMVYDLTEFIPNHRDHVPDLEGIADGLADLEYVVLGANLTFGIPADAVFEAVQAANMDKVGPEGPIYREDGKALKREGWQPADIRAVLDLA